MGNLSAHNQQTRESARRANGEFGSWEAEESAATLSSMVFDSDAESADETDAAATRFDETIDWYRQNIGESYPHSKKPGLSLHPGEAQGQLNDAAVELARTPGGPERLNSYFNDPQYQGGDGVSRAVGAAVLSGLQVAETDDRQYQQEDGRVDPQRPLGNEEVTHGDPLTVDDGLSEIKVTAHGNFTGSGHHINVDGGDGLILAVKREELRRRPTEG